MVRYSIMDRFWAGILRLLMRVAGVFPLRWHYMWADVITWFLKNVLHYRQDVIYTNLARSFPGKPYWELRKVADDFYRHMGEMIAEAVWFAGCRSGKRLRKAGIVDVVNPEVLADAYERSSSVMIFYSHCGNWELLGGFPFYAADGWVDRTHVYVAYKALKNKVWNRVIVENRRSPQPDYEGQLESAGLLRGMLSRRGQKNMYFINNDQYPYQAKCEIGTFLNQDSVGMSASAAIACKLGMNVLYMRMVNDRRGHYSIYFEPLCEDASQTTAEELTKIYHEHLQAEILETPHNWLWSHKRWKNAHN